MTDATMGALLARLSAAADRIEAQRRAVERGVPWPVGSLARGEAEERWGPTEVLAHVAEMLPFWLGEMERVLAGAPGDVAAFGRTIDDQVRNLSVARDASLPPRELLDRVAAAVERYRRRLPSLTAAELSRIGRHPARGELRVPALLERFAVEHLEDHARQLESALAVGPGAG